MINQRWLYTEKAIQRYLHGIIFLCKKICLSPRNQHFFCKATLNFHYYLFHFFCALHIACYLSLKKKKKKKMSASLTQFLDSYFL